MKRIQTCFLTFIVFFTSTFGQSRSISMTSALPVGSVFQFDIATKVNDTQIFVDFGEGSLSHYTINTVSSTISGNLGSSKNVIIYGDDITSFTCNYKQLTVLSVYRDTALKYLDCSQNYLTELDVTDNYGLNTLYCSSNQLTSLDISNNSALLRLKCMSNEISELDIQNNPLLVELDCASNRLNTLNVSKNEELNYLDCSNNQLSVLDVSQNENLQTFYCFSNKLETLNITMNKGLHDFSCNYNQLSSLNLSQNIALQIARCSSNKLTSLNIDNNTALLTLDCSFNQLTSLNLHNVSSLEYFNCNDNQFTLIDVTANKSLIGLYCYFNRLNTLDVSQNTALKYLKCNNNYLTSIDLSFNTQLKQLDIRNNYFTFSSLPLKSIEWSTYIYAPQRAISISKNTFIGEELDLSSQLSVSGNPTVYKWITRGGTLLINGTDYNFTNGKTVFLIPLTDSVYCMMTNSIFPDFTNDALLTSKTNVSLSTFTDYLKSNDLKIVSKNNLLKIIASYEAQISIYDINGRLLICKPIVFGDNDFSLPIGVYVVKIAGNNKLYTRKVVVE